MQNRSTFAKSFGMFALLLLVARPAIAQAPVPPLQPGQVDIVRSRVYVKAPSRRFGNDHAIEGRLYGGYATLGAAQQAGELVFNMATFLADTNVARNFINISGDVSEANQKELTETMQGPDILDVAKFGVAKLRLNSLVEDSNRRQVDPPMYSLEADLTFHGETRPLTLHVVGEEIQGMMRLKCTFNLKQSDFGIAAKSHLFGTVGVQDILRVHGDIWVKMAEKE